MILALQYKHLYTDHMADKPLVWIGSFAEAICVLHAFEKRTRKTARADIDIAKRRLLELIRMRRDF